MRENFGDNDLYNISLERIDNNAGYTKGNVVFIRVWLQYGFWYNLNPQQM